ncbi:dihydroxyacetone kinase family protein [Microbacterium tenebrionis]|uniref:dihydroxyacetone kinase family protein n=1 Tax=Microbacterium tenebrionis TaxID=2830665 RepID=UPI00158ED785|nr:dihydroxyacetone kinase family protein [Microbacterium ihumii]
MKKLINAPDAFVDEFLDGILRAHPDQLRPASEDRRAIVRVPDADGPVGIATGGGSGHLPLFLGYLGEGLCSGVAVGNVFSSPSSEQILAATVASDAGAGVLYLYGNYGGDVFNFDLAGDLAAARGIRTSTVLGADDVASAPADRADTRRGVAGIFFAYKIAGASAARGDDLDAVATVAARAAVRTGTMGVDLSPTILPTTGRPSFDLADGEMEIGIGIHGETGRGNGPLAQADEIVDTIVAEILEDRAIAEGHRVALLVNGMGATPLEELYVLSRRAHQLLDERGIVIHRTYVGEYATSLEMAGASISIVDLDDELQELLDAPAASPFFTQRGPAPASREALPAREAAAVASAPATVASAVPSAQAGAFARDIAQVATLWAEYADELRDLDAVLGDGDLGVTVASGSAAIRRALSADEADSLTAVLQTAGGAFATANPSTFAALFGGGLLAAADALRQDPELTRSAAARALRAMADRIGERGGAVRGDKTVLDALIPSIEALELSESAPQAIEAMRAAAWDGVRATAGAVSQRGRAAWIGERGAGHADPGATAYARLLDAVERSRGGEA